MLISDISEYILWGIYHSNWGHTSVTQVLQLETFTCVTTGDMHIHIINILSSMWGLPCVTTGNLHMLQQGTCIHTCYRCFAFYVGTSMCYNWGPSCVLQLGTCICVTTGGMHIHGIGVLPSMWALACVTIGDFHMHTYAHTYIHTYIHTCMTKILLYSQHSQSYTSQHPVTVQILY
jgi:hypothetical protein